MLHAAAVVLSVLTAAPPPVVSLVELAIAHRASPGLPAMNKRVRVAHPKGWTGDVEQDGRTIRLYGPKGEGEMLITVVSHPSQLGPHLEELKRRHPGAAPGPPGPIDVPGINIERGERSTRFPITGREFGEMVTVERGEVIVLFATLVSPNAWKDVQADVTRCYPTVEVVDRAMPK